MFFSKRTLKRSVILGIILISGVTFATQYHQPDLFPIGFSGFSYTWYSTDKRQPYPNEPETYPYGTWAWEDTLLRRTHCNFIGCSDAWGDIDKNMILDYTVLNFQTI